jgi:hypothetical protein
MAKKPLSLTLQTNGRSIAKIDPGQFLLDDGVAAKAITLKTVFSLANATGGPVTLNEAQKLLVLDSFQINLKWGSPKMPQQMFNSVGCRKMREIARTLQGTELQGFENTVDGMQQAMADGTTTELILYQRIPLGYFWRFIEPAFLAFGKTQMASLALEVKKIDSVAILANITFDGPVEIAVMPDEVHTEGGADPVSPGIVYDESDGVKITESLPEGMPIQVTERSAAHTSSALTDVTVKVGNLIVHEQVSPEELITESTDVVNYPADASTVDEVTHLYNLNAQGASLDPAKVPTGEVSVKQNKKDLATIKLSQLRIPVLGREVMEDFVDYATKTIIKGKRKLVSSNLAWRLGLPVHSSFVAPGLLEPETTSLAQKLPGLVGGPGLVVDTIIPDTTLNRVRATVNAHKSVPGNAEAAAAEAAIQELAAGIPGAVGSANGFHSGDTSLLDRVRRIVG